MSFTVKHLKVAYQAGRDNLPFAVFAKVLAYLDGDAPLPDPVPATEGKLKRKPGRPRRVLAGTDVGNRKVVAPGKTSKRRQRGDLSKSILHFLESVAPNGKHIKEIAKAVKSKPANITAWYYSTGQKNKAIRKVGEATFAYQPKKEAAKAKA